MGKFCTKLRFSRWLMWQDPNHDAHDAWHQASQDQRRDMRRRLKVQVKREPERLQVTEWKSCWNVTCAVESAVPYRLFRLSTSPDLVFHFRKKYYLSQVSLKMLALFLMGKCGVARAGVRVLMLPVFLCTRYFLSSRISKWMRLVILELAKHLGYQSLAACGRYSTRSTRNSFVTWKAPSTTNDVTSESVQTVPDSFVNIEGSKGNEDGIRSFPPISGFNYLGGQNAMWVGKNSGDVPHFLSTVTQLIKYLV